MAPLLVSGSYVLVGRWEDLASEPKQQVDVVAGRITHAFLELLASTLLVIEVPLAPREEILAARVRFAESSVTIPAGFNTALPAQVRRPEAWSTQLRMRLVAGIRLVELEASSGTRARRARVPDQQRVVMAGD